MTISSQRRGTGGPTLARNTVCNIAGQVSPALVAVFVLPILVHQLGVDRIGLLTLAWMTIGYFSVFDFGLSRALTQHIAERIKSEEPGELGSGTWTGLLVMAGFGTVGMAGVLLFAGPIVHCILNVPLPLQREAISVLRLLAITLPAVVTTAGLRGILEAHQRFDWVNAIRVPMGIFNFLGPLLVIPFSHSLTPITVLLAASRFVGFAIHLGVCLRVMPALRAGVRPRARLVGGLLRYGGWVSVSNLMGPLISMADRLCIGAVLPIAALAYYTTPQEVVSKLGIVSASIASVLFPAFAGSFARDRQYVAVTFVRGIKSTFFLMLPVCLAAIAFARPGLDIWVGADFARHTAAILQWQALAVFLSCFVQLPFALFQACGRPDLTVKFQLYEIPVYALLMWWAVQTHGVMGAAVAWTVRYAIEIPVLALLVRRFTDIDKGFWRVLAAAVGASGFAFLLVGIVPDLKIRTAVFVFICAVHCAIAWRFVFSPRERIVLRSLIPGVALPKIQTRLSGIDES